MSMFISAYEVIEAFEKGLLSQDEARELLLGLKAINPRRQVRGKLVEAATSAPGEVREG